MGFDNLKLTKYRWWEKSGGLLCDSGQLELTVITGQFGLLCRQVYKKVSNQASNQASKQAVKVNSSIFVNQPNATNLKSSKTPF